MTSNDIANKVKNEVLDTYPQDGINIVIPAPDNFSFQLTSSSNELNSIQEEHDNGMSIINFGICENLLKDHNQIHKNASLVILKYEKLTGVGSEKSIQYEVYNPNDYQQLDLSICENVDIDILIPIHVDDEITNLYNNLKENGYDLFDRNNKFYIDICTPFQAENGADILLADRLYFFFSKVVNLTTCPSNCQYSSFSIDRKYLSCKCEVDNENIDLVNTDKFLGKLLYDLNDYVLKYTSYKTMKCHKLVFSFKHFIKNAGSIILLILLFIYIGFFMYYVIKGLLPLKVAISKILFNDKNVDNKISPFLDIKTRNKYKPTQNKSTKGNNPPKKQLISRSMQKKNVEKKAEKEGEKKKEKIEEKKTEKNKVNDSKIKASNQNKTINSINNNIIIIDELENDNEYILKDQINIINNNPNIVKNKNSINDDRTNNSFNYDTTNNSINYDTTNNSINYDKSNNTKINFNNKEKTIQINASGTKSFYMNMNLGSSKKSKLREADKKPKKSEAQSVKSKVSKKRVKKNVTNSEREKPKRVIFKDVLESNTSMIKEQIIKKEEKTLDDYELNHLGYFDALQLDKRNYCRTYFSILNRDQNILYTCFSFNDYNLFYVKMAKFIFIISNLMAMNAFLFADKSFHKLFISGVHYYFSYQILQIVLSVIITYVVEIILCYITLTDRYIYKIKLLAKEDINVNKIFSILKCIRNKLLVFYVVALIILLFYWYFVSAFCAVYPNTQKIYIIDCLLSFIFFSIIPFIVYAITTLLRIISLKDVNKKRFKCLYIVGKSFPIF